MVTDFRMLKSMSIDLKLSSFLEMVFVWRILSQFIAVLELSCMSSQSAWPTCLIDCFYSNCSHVGYP